MEFQNFKHIADADHVPMFSWQGASGYWYTHSVFLPLELPWFSTGHFNYVFAHRPYDGSRVALYVGETDNFRRHEKWSAATLLGMNEIHVHLLASSERRRLAIETDLRQGQAPILNLQ
jgi:hypothetical protein